MENPDPQVSADGRVDNATQKGDKGMTESIACQDPFDLAGVRDHREYARALAALIGQGRRERCVALLSETEAHAVAELLGQYAQLEPTAALNQLAATLASRLYSRLGA